MGWQRAPPLLRLSQRHLNEWLPQASVVLVLWEKRIHHGMASNTWNHPASPENPLAVGSCTVSCGCRDESLRSSSRAIWSLGLHPRLFYDSQLPKERDFPTEATLFFASTISTGG